MLGLPVLPHGSNDQEALSGLVAREIARFASRQAVALES